MEITEEEQKRLDGLTPEELLAEINNAGLKVSFEKYLNSQKDTAVTKALETRTANLSSEKQTLEARVKELENKLELGNRDTLVKTVLKEAGLKEDYSKLIKSNTAEEIKSEVQTLKEVLTNQDQKLIDQKLENGELGITTPAGGEEKEVDKSIDEYVKSKKAGKNVKSEFKDGQFQLTTQKESE